jgi:hypothetical protein
MRWARLSPLGQAVLMNEPKLEQRELANARIKMKVSSRVTGAMLFRNRAVVKNRLEAITNSFGVLPNGLELSVHQRMTEGE